MDGMEGHADLLQLLATIEASACLTPRNRLELGLLPRSSGDASKGVDKLHSAAVGSLSLSNSNSEAVCIGIRCLLALGELCRELECSERLGLIGGHQSIVRLMTREQGTMGTRGCEEIENNADPPTTSPGESGRQQLQHVLNGRDVNPTDVDVVSGDPGMEAVGDEQEEEEEGKEGEGDEDEVQSAAAVVASRIVSTGCSFPMRLSFPAGEGSSGLGRFPLQYDFTIAHSASGRVATAAAPVADSEASDAPADEDGAARQATPRPASQHQNPRLPKAGDPKSSTTETASSNNGGESISILVRPVKERQHSQFDVGFVMWPAAVILSRLLCRDPDLIRGRRVLEIGAGLGLAGLVAARIQQGYLLMSSLTGENKNHAGDGDGTVTAAAAAAASVTLSDFNPVVLEALEANVALNADCSRGTKAAAGDADGGAGQVHVRHLDWDKLVDEGAPVVHAEASGAGGPGCGAEATRAATAPVDVSSNCAGHDAVENLKGHEGDRRGLSDYESDSGLSLDGRANGEQGGVGLGGIESIQHGERFDVIIASDHICQASDAEGTIRVLKAMLSEEPPPSSRLPRATASTTMSTTSPTTSTTSTTLTTPMTTTAEMRTTTKKGGEAHFVVAHPRTRWGVDALVPLLQKCPELSFTCEEICDPQLVAGLEEAAYLAWLYVRVWRRPEPAAADVVLVTG